MSVGFLQQYTLSKGNLSTASPSSIEINDIVTLGITYDEKDPYFKNSIGEQNRIFNFTIVQGERSKIISIGKTDMYEITQPLQITRVVIDEGFPESLQINICHYAEEEE